MTASGLALALDAQQQPALPPGTAAIRWLGDTAPGVASGVSFGVPWPRGAVSRTQTFSLTASDGGALPLQAWPLAYWPDGSIKWTGFAAVAHTAGEYRLQPGRVRGSRGGGEGDGVGGCGRDRYRQDPRARAEEAAARFWIRSP